MKKAVTLIAFVLIATGACAQIHNYPFGTFYEETDSGPQLQEVLSCGAVNGAFLTTVINSTNYVCGMDAQPVYHFGAGAGVSYPNGAVTGTYTLHLFFSFDNVSGYRRLIDFKNGTANNGLYIVNGSLNLYPHGNVGVVNSFQANTFYVVSLVRDDVTKQISVYVDGSPVGSYSDAAGNYAAATTATPIILFRDNVSGVGQCESSGGYAKHFSIKPATSTASEVALYYTNICFIVLPVELISFTVKRTGSENLLAWKTAKEEGSQYFEMQRSRDGIGWEALGKVAANGNTKGAYSFIDRYPTNGTNYYRLKIVDDDGSYKYSNVAVQKNEATATGSIQVLNNPASADIRLDMTDMVAMEGGQVSLLDMQGKLMWKTTNVEKQISIPVSEISDGVYFLQYSNGQTRLREKVMVRH